MRSRNHKRKYGITITQRDAILQAQGNICGVCGAASPGKIDWNTDHDHSTKQVRGVLCGGCNVLLGRLGDSIQGVINWHARLVAYLSGAEQRVGSALFPEQAQP